MTVKGTGVTRSMKLLVPCTYTPRHFSKFICQRKDVLSRGLLVRNEADRKRSCKPLRRLQEGALLCILNLGGSESV